MAMLAHDDIDDMADIMIDGYFSHMSVDTRLDHIVSSMTAIEDIDVEGVTAYVDDFGTLMVDIASDELAMANVVHDIGDRLKKRHAIDPNAPKFYESSVKSAFLSIMLALCPTDIKTVRYYFKNMHGDMGMLESFIDDCCEVDSKSGIITLKPRSKAIASKHANIDLFWHSKKVHSRYTDMLTRGESKNRALMLKVVRQGHTRYGNTLRRLYCQSAKLDHACRELFSQVLKTKEVLTSVSGLMRSITMQALIFKGRDMMIQNILIRRMKKISDMSL